MARGQVPAILWGASYANTVTFGYPLFDPTTWSEDAPGSEWIEGASGVVDTWITGTRHRLRGDWRFIPSSDSTNPVATGWTGATGVRAFFEWARAGNAFRFAPDKDTPGTYFECLLVSPRSGAPTVNPDGTRNVDGFEIRTTDDSEIPGF